MYMKHSAISHIVTCDMYISQAAISHIAGCHLYASIEQMLKSLILCCIN